MSTDRLFRKNVFGGFNKDDVIDYIENMKNEFFEYRSQVEQTVKELNGKVASLENDVRTANQKLAEANKKAAEAIENSEAATAAAEKAAEEKLAKEKAALAAEKSENDPLGEINLATDRLRRVADEICDNLSSFIEKISESSFAVTIAQPEPSFEVPAEKSEEKEEIKEEKEAEKTAEPDAASILSFIDGLLASTEEKIKKETEKKEEKSCLDGLLPESLFN